MQVECIFFGPFREAVGVKRVERDTESETVGDLLRELEADYPALDGRLVGDGNPSDSSTVGGSDDGSGDGPAGQTVVTKNTKDVRHLDGLETRLEAGDVIRLTPSVYGGTDARIRGRRSEGDER